MSATTTLSHGYTRSGPVSDPDKRLDDEEAAKMIERAEATDSAAIRTALRSRLAAAGIFAPVNSSRMPEPSAEAAATETAPSEAASKPCGGTHQRHRYGVGRTTCQRCGAKWNRSKTSDTDPAPSTGSSALREMTSGGTVPQQPGSVLHGKDVTDGDAPRGLREDDGLHRDGVQIEGADAAQRPPCPRADAARSQGRDGRGDVLPEQVDARSRGETVDVADLASARARPGAGSTPAESTLPPSEPQQGASAPPCPAAALPPTGPAASLVPPAAGPVPPRVRVPRTVVQGFYDCRIDPGEYEACWNRYGAVSVVLPDGKQAGLKPDEFDWICGKPEPIGMEQHGKVWRPGHGESCESLLLYAPRRPLIDATSALRAADEREQSPVGVAGGATNAREEGDPDRYVLLAVVPGPHGDAPAQGPERSNPEPSFPCRCWAAGSATTCPRCAEVGPGPRVAEAGGDVAARVVLRRFLEDVRRACETAINLIGTEE